MTCSRHKIKRACLSAIAVIIAAIGYNYHSKPDRSLGNPPLRISTENKRSRPQAPAGCLRGSNSTNWSERSLSVNDATELLNAAITPEVARNLLERSKVEIKGIRDRARFSSSVMASLCKQGYSAEAWELIESNSGAVRELEIGTVFQYGKEPLSSLASKLETLVDPAERMQALRALISSRPTEIANIDFNEITMTSPQDKIAVVSGILSIISASNGPNATATDISNTQALLQKSVDLVRDRKLDVENLIKILNNDVTGDAFNQWSLMDGLKKGVEPKDLDRLRATVVPNMIRTDADKSMNLICSDPTTKYSVPVISSAINSMYEYDPQQANVWVTTHLSSLDPATGQRIVASVAQVSMRNGEYDTAKQWANQLLSPTVKQQVLDQINAAQEAKKSGKN